MTAGEAIRDQRRTSAIINTVLSTVFFALVFGLTPRPLSLALPDRLALDFVPQSLAIGFFSALVPALIIAAKRRRGGIAGLDPVTAGWPVIVARAAAFALAAILLGGVIALALNMVDGRVGYFAALLTKMVYGALLGWLITPRAVGMVLGKG
jgi:hypothetical protein